MNRLPAPTWRPCLVCLLCLAWSCGGSKGIVIADLPPHPTERVTPPAPVPPPAPEPVAEGAPPLLGSSELLDPAPQVPADSAGTASSAAIDGVDPERVRAWRASRGAGVAFQQTMTLTTGGKGDRSMVSRIQVLGDRNRRDDLAPKGGVVQTSLTLPDDVIMIDHAARTWTTMGGRLDKIVKDASSWYFQKDFRGLQRWTRVADQVLDGVHCEVYERRKSAPAGDGDAAGTIKHAEKVWFARDLDGFAMRYESNSFLGLNVTVTRTQVVKAAVAEADFQVPAGYTKATPGR